VLLGGGGALAAAALGPAAWAEERRLKEIGARKGLLVGTAAETRELREHPDYGRLIAEQTAMLTATHELNWRTVHPAPDRFDFRAADQLLGWCAERGLKFRGGSLAWYMLYPRWLESVAPGEAARTALSTYVATVAGRYRGRMHSWDVVNEPIFTEDRRPDGLRNNIWVRLVGPDYIDLAFRRAHEADPQAVLVLNEYGFYYTHPYHELRRQALLRLLRQLKERGTPVHALGIQSHLSPQGPWGTIDKPRFGQFLREVAGLGYKLMITELDVADAALPADIATRDRIAAEAAEDYLDFVLAERAVTALIVWQLSDRFSWITWSSPRPDRQPPRPLPYDAALRRKPLWDAIARALERAPARPA
jgi:endo-1,4-beta-xylanase